MRGAPAAALFLACWLAGQTQLVAAPQDQVAAAPQPPVTAAVAADDLLLFAVQFDTMTLSEALQAHGDPQDPLLPIGELSRLIDLAVDVNPTDGLATGRLGESQRPLTIDLRSGKARSGTIDVQLMPGDALTSPVDIYVKASLLSRLLPVNIVIDADNLLLTLVPREKLPLQARRERAERLVRLGESPATADTVMKVESPYRWLGLPAFDVIAEIGGDSERGGLLGRFEGRVAADLLRTDVTGYLATNDRGRPRSARIKAEKRSLTGNLLGPINATYVGIGDIFSPALALGPRSMGGAGAVFSTARLEDVSVFERINLRGELPLGFDVELYVNDVLRAQQNTATQGRYEFLDVPLVKGVNIIRIVTYGPRGERQEETRVVNLGGGQIEKGRTVIDAGIVRQDEPVFDLQRDRFSSVGRGRGRPRAVVSIAHGLTSTITITAGGAIFTDPADVDRRLVSAGLRTSLAGFAVQLDHAHDLTTGSATSLGLAGRVAGISLLARHAEYRGGFADENIAQFDVSRPFRRYSELTFDFALPFSTRMRLPISGRLERAQFADGGTAWVARGRTSLSVADTLVALGIDYTRQSGPGFVTRRLSGSIAASRLIDYKWQLRASTDIDIVPETRLRATTFTVDRAISDRDSIRFGLAKAFGEVRDLTIQAGYSARLPFADLSLVGDYSTDQCRWRIGLQVNFGIAYDPFRGGYRLTPPGPAAGASASLQAFRDHNANGRPDAGEEPVEGIVLVGPRGPIKTDAAGRAFVTGLGDGASGMLRTDASDVDTVFSATPPSAISFVPRPGDVLKLYYPLVPTSEVAVRLRLRQPDGTMAGLAAVRVRLVPEKGDAIEGATEFDGAMVFEQVRPGRYQLMLDPDQAGQLGMRLAAPVGVEVGAEGTTIAISGEILFERSSKP